MDLDKTEGVTEKCTHLEYNRRDEEIGPRKADPNTSRVSGELLAGCHGGRLELE